MDDSRSKLQGDLLHQELKSLDTLETWGASLFLGAIALVSKQLIDWSRPPDADTPSLVLHAPIFLLPAVVGLFAFIFLRVVNFRIRRIRDQLYRLAELTVRPRVSFGFLGWLMSLMPLLLGYGASWYFTIERPQVEPLYWLFLSIGVDVLVAALLIFFFFSQAAVQVQALNMWRAVHLYVRRLKHRIASLTTDRNRE